MKKLQFKPSSKWIEYVLISALIAICLFIRPSSLIVLAFILLYKHLSYEDELEYDDLWIEVETGTDLILGYTFIDVEYLPDFINEYFDEAPLVEFEDSFDLEFFQGYFTNFIIERSDGIFIQKVILNEDETEIQSLPLYFFDYASKKVTLIRDLKGYDIDAKGGSDDFIIYAIGEEGDLEIRFVKE